ncbi:hypothetical protein ASPSYDRAFT_26968 [Aspergillus sydowii CBS 593.65]|uniref:Uncharacterized protein n=1 Tax=Aspergillus sydowii CBS 593.65 TaxID=1036612 RepID=A0A1L9U0F0_9EURO|nr:uncharacterized protein ASPSYDRAFT_26968 [Aspergillus sydowii CBS 593.65]OJJ65003.1 hypothetical protein ASPSYDRAFT_26968 [Aspergillus sydowii CBS 593.65]
MSFLPSIRASTRLSLRPGSTAILPSTTSAFHTSAARSGLKEGDQSRDNLNQHYESEKQGQIKRQKEGQGKWNQNLASNSEASVKADRGEVQGKEDFVDLQDKTKNEPNKKG